MKLVSRGRLNSCGWLHAFALGVLLAAFQLVWMAAHPLGAQAADRYLFDPGLSLTGSCATEEVDPVPDPWCPGPPAPSAPFENPSIAIDSFGDMYVSSHKDEGPGGRVDVFSPAGQFLTEIAIEGARSLAVDADGNLYVDQFVTGGLKQVSRYAPSVYKPAEEEITYGNPGVVVVETETPGLCGSGATLSSTTGVAVDPDTGRLYVSPGLCVGEWGSAAEHNEPRDLTIGSGVISEWGTYLAVDTTLDRLYVSDAKEDPTKGTIEVFDLEDPHAYLGMLNGADTPAGKILSGTGDFTVAVNEVNGHLFIADLRGARKVYEMGSGLGAAEEYLATFEHEFKFVKPGQIAVDNSPVSPNEGSFYVPSASAGGGLYHTFAFRRTEIGPPEVESASATEVTTTEAILRARINPGGDPTEYHFEYTTQSHYEEAGGFSGATVVDGGTLPAGGQGVDVAAAVTGLETGTAYRFRVVAENSIGEDNLEGSFRTYPTTAPGGGCPNEVLRTGFSAGLPDCRAYELVTPPDTNGRSPVGTGEFGIYFPTLLASPDGDRATFRVEGGSLPGSEGAGPFNGENYLARRGPDGWSSELAGPSGTDALAPQPGGASPDQEHSFWSGEIPGELTLIPYIRYPDGHSEPVGRGSLGTDPRVEAELIAPDGSHVIFATNLNSPQPPVQLEPDAPPTGTAAVYDRTADEVTHVVSLLPGNVTPAAGQNAIYVGASYDGRGIAFEIGGTLYLRQDNQTTYEVGKGVTFAGIAEGGGRIFYLQSGNLYALDTATGTRIAFSKGGSTTPVNVSADGSSAYFVSPNVLSGKASNPNGAVAQAGKENLYLSREGAISFVGTVAPEDVEGEPLGNGEVLGLGRWVAALNQGRPGLDPSRTSGDGSVILFEASVPLTGYDPESHVEIFRYDANAPSLTCLSCNPTGAPADSDASLQTVLRQFGESSTILSTFARIPNLRADGDRAFFQSFEALVPADVDGHQDVYEWEAQGIGSCTQPGGCIYLISSPSSARDEHLFGASSSGDDVFFLSSGILLGVDSDETPSIYDARVDGGFPEAETPACQGEGCRGALAPPPALPSPATPANGKSGNVLKHPCPKGKRKVRRHGKVRCVKKRRHRPRHHAHHSTKGTGK